MMLQNEIQETDIKSEEDQPSKGMIANTVIIHESRVNNQE